MLTGIGAEVDDEVVLIGRQGNEAISAEEVAAWSDTIVYEVFTGLSERLPRIYHRFPIAPKLRKFANLHVEVRSRPVTLP